MKFWRPRLLHFCSCCLFLWFSFIFSLLPLKLFGKRHFGHVRFAIFHRGYFYLFLHLSTLELVFFLFGLLINLSSFQLKLLCKGRSFDWFGKTYLSSTGLFFHFFLTSLELLRRQHSYLWRVELILTFIWVHFFNLLELFILLSFLLHKYLLVCHRCTPNLLRNTSFRSTTAGNMVRNVYPKLWHHFMTNG